MELMKDKVVVVFGVANKRSIAWGITKALAEAGATLALNYQNDRMGEPVKKLAAELEGDTVLAPCDVTVEGDIEKAEELTFNKGEVRPIKPAEDAAEPVEAGAATQES